MLNDNNIREEIIDSLSDENVPNNPGKIKALYLDRQKERNKPWYKYSRIYAVCGPALAAVLAVAIVVPITLSARRGPKTHNSPGETYVSEFTKIESSNNQIAFATMVLGNAVNSLNTTDKLPSELLANSSFEVLKNLYIVNSYMYTAEQLLAEEFNPSYSTSVDSVDSELVNLSIQDSDITSSYYYTSKSNYDGEENYSLTGSIHAGGNDYVIEGSKAGMFGYYISGISMYLDAEKTYGFKVNFDQDLLSDQIIYVEEFRDNKILATTTISLETRTSSKGGSSYFVNAEVNDMTFVINRLNNNDINIDIFVDNKQTDSFLVKVDEDNNKYNYINSELGLDFNLKRK